MPSNRDYPTIYSLPALDVDLIQQSSWHPWIAEFIGLTPEAATRRLQVRWESIERPCMKELRDVLGEFEVRAVVDNKGEGMIYAERPDADQDIVGNAFYLPAPLDKQVLKSQLSAVSLRDNLALEQFLTHFAGLAEDPPTAGHFVGADTPWPTLSGERFEQAEGFSDWENALMVWHARDGCRGLVRRDGAVGWWHRETGEIERFANTFDEFASRFAEHRKTAWPFDPYGPPDPRLTT